MSKGIQNYTNVTTSSADYPNGRTKNNTGLNDGTPMDVDTMGDYQQYHAKVLRDASVTPNNLPDNTTNGFQLNQAARLNYKRVGAYVPFNGSSSIVVSGHLSPLVEIVSGASGVGAIGLQDASFAEFEFNTVVVVNNSSNTFNIVSGDGIDGVNTLAIAPGDRFEFCQIKSLAKWVQIQ